MLRQSRKALYKNQSVYHVCTTTHLWRGRRKFDSHLGVSVSSKGPRLDQAYLPTADMSERQKYEVISARMLPGSTRSVSDVEEPGQPDQNWATGGIGGQEIKYI